MKIKIYTKDPLKDLSEQIQVGVDEDRNGFYLIEVRKFEVLSDD